MSIPETLSFPGMTTEKCRRFLLLQKIESILKILGHKSGAKMCVFIWYLTENSIKNGFQKCSSSTFRYDCKQPTHFNKTFKLGVNLLC